MIDDDDNCDSLHDAQRASVATLIFSVITLCMFTVLAARSYVNAPLLLVTGVFTLIQSTCSLLTCFAFLAA